MASLNLLKNKVIWISGLILSIFMGLFGYVLFKNCTDDVLCIFFVALPFIPGILLNLEGITSILISLIFWFLLGSLIGFLVYKIKKNKS